MSGFIGNRLRTARTLRKMTLKELSNQIGVSSQALSQYEKDIIKPSIEVVFNLSNVLEFPRHFFYQEGLTENVSNTFFRAKAVTTKKSEIAMKNYASIMTEIVMFLSEHINFPSINIPLINTDNNIESISMEVRKSWGVGNDPIKDIVSLLERNGFFLSEVDIDERIDAFTQSIYYGGNTYYTILTDTDKSMVRRQFSLSHELGHIILHDQNLHVNELTNDELNKIEDEANAFAAAFLLPKDAFYKDLHSPTELDLYVILKKKWRVSIQAMIMRARNLELVSQNQYNYLVKKVSSKGWRTSEPYDNELSIYKPILLNKATELLLSNKFNEEEFYNELCNRISIKREMVEDILLLKRGRLSKKIPQINNDNIIQLKTFCK